MASGAVALVAVIGKAHTQPAVILSITTCNRSRLEPFLEMSRDGNKNVTAKTVAAMT